MNHDPFGDDAWVDWIVTSILFCIGGALLALGFFAIKELFL